jgi:serine/threonine protein kinase
MSTLEPLPYLGQINRGDIKRICESRWTLKQKEKLGSGTFGTVYAGSTIDLDFKTKNGGIDTIAVKVFHIKANKITDEMDEDEVKSIKEDNERARQQFKSYEREVETARQLQNQRFQYMPKYYDAFECDGKAYIVMQKMDGTLSNYLQELADDPTHTADSLVSDYTVMTNKISKMVVLMHRCGVMHNDLHINNILYKTTGLEQNDVLLTICDFGSSSTVAKNDTPFQPHPSSQPDKFYAQLSRDDLQLFEDELIFGFQSLLNDIRTTFQSAAGELHLGTLNFKNTIPERYASLFDRERIYFAKHPTIDTEESIEERYQFKESIRGIWNKEVSNKRKLNRYDAVIEGMDTGSSVAFIEVIMGIRMSSAGMLFYQVKLIGEPLVRELTISELKKIDKGALGKIQAFHDFCKTFVK